MSKRCVALDAAGAANVAVVVTQQAFQVSNSFNLRDPPAG
jgi:hypothetical protein